MSGFVKSYYVSVLEIRGDKCLIQWLYGNDSWMSLDDIHDHMVEKYEIWAKANAPKTKYPRMTEKQLKIERKFIQQKTKSCRGNFDAIDNPKHPLINGIAVWCDLCETWYYEDCFTRRNFNLLKQQSNEFLPCEHKQVEEKYQVVPFTGKPKSPKIPATENKYQEVLFNMYNDVDVDITNNPQVIAEILTFTEFLKHQIKFDKDFKEIGESALQRVLPSFKRTDQIHFENNAKAIESYMIYLMKKIVSKDHLVETYKYTSSPESILADKALRYALKQFHIDKLGVIIENNNFPEKLVDHMNAFGRELLEANNMYQEFLLESKIDKEAENSVLSLKIIEELHTFREFCLFTDEDGTAHTRYRLEHPRRSSVGHEASNAEAVKSYVLFMNLDLHFSSTSDDFEYDKIDEQETINVSRSLDYLIKIFNSEGLKALIKRRKSPALLRRVENIHNELVIARILWNEFIEMKDEELKNREIEDAKLNEYVQELVKKLSFAKTFSIYMSKIINVTGDYNMTLARFTKPGAYKPKSEEKENYVKAIELYLVYLMKKLMDIDELKRKYRYVVKDSGEEISITKSLDYLLGMNLNEMSEEPNISKKNIDHIKQIHDDLLIIREMYNSSKR